MEVNKIGKRNQIDGIENNLNPLVSIIVITYNSSKFVVETLESAKAQTYDNIELIISDDCSKDDTIEVCRRWIENNEDWFVKTELIIVEKNTGIPANCNRGLKVAQGEWVKLIAGDDILLHNCIADNVFFANQYENCYIVHSDYDRYLNTFNVNNLIKNDVDWRYKSFLDNKISQEKQKKILYYSCPISAPTVMVRKSALIDVNGFDEAIPLMEDMPMWIKLSEAGYKFYYMSKTTIGYRSHAYSTSVGSINTLFNVKFTKSVELMYNKYTKKNYSVCGRFYRMMFFSIQYKMDWLGLNNRNLFSIHLHEVFRRLVENYTKKELKKTEIL